MQARENIRSISLHKNHAAQLWDERAAAGARLFINQNGEAAMVTEGVHPHHEKRERGALLKLLAMGEEDRQAGLGLSVEASRAQLARRRQQR